MQLSEYVETILDHYKNAVDLTYQIFGDNPTPEVRAQIAKKFPEVVNYWALYVNQIADAVMDLGSIVRDSEDARDALSQYARKKFSGCLYEDDPGFIFILAGVKDAAGALAYLLENGELDSRNHKAQFVYKYHNELSTWLGSDYKFYGQSYKLLAQYGVTSCIKSSSFSGFGDLGVPIAVVVGVVIVASLAAIGTTIYFTVGKYQEEKTKQLQITKEIVETQLEKMNEIRNKALEIYRSTGDPSILSWLTETEETFRKQASYTTSLAAGEEQEEEPWYQPILSTVKWVAIGGVIIAGVYLVSPMIIQGAHK